ncbi:MAG: hypothetical protein HKN76_18300 [Saprospiraceae bacterium]|nr:hypothetical protein [Saprospiraceae bacterium]
MIKRVRLFLSRLRAARIPVKYIPIFRRIKKNKLTREKESALAKLGIRDRPVSTETKTSEITVNHLKNIRTSMR